MKTLLAHPLVESITWWDVKDGAWLKAPSGFFRTDGSVKPSYYALKDLVKNELWYHAKNHHVNNQGRLEFYGPLGDYKLSLQGRDYKFNVKRSGQEKISLNLH